MLNADIISKKLVDLRGSKSREEVANANKISVSALGMYETGKRIPRDEIKLSLARYYKISIEELFCGYSSQLVNKYKGNQSFHNGNFGTTENRPIIT